MNNQSIRATRSGRLVAIAMSVAAVVASTSGGVALAEGRESEGETGTGRVGAVITDLGLDGSGIPESGPDLMPDSLTQAIAKYPTEECAYVGRNDRSTSGAPANASQQEVIYFRPTDAPNTRFDQGTVCRGGETVESNIGYANHNGRRWMGSQTTTQGARISGKGYRFRIRAYTAYSRNFQFVDVMYVIGQQNSAYYGTDTYARLSNELNARGWNNVNAKYLVFADLQANTNASTGISPAGTAAYNGNKAFMFRKLRTRAADGSLMNVKYRWGCNDEGDGPAIHEGTHTMGAVQPTAPDYYAAGTGSSSNHVTQTSDIMNKVLGSSFSGTAANGGTYPGGPLQWDMGADSYTGRILAYPNYLVGSPSQSPHTC